jgi:hypothetical protein
MPPLPCDGYSKAWFESGPSAEMERLQRSSRLCPSTVSEGSELSADVGLD